MEAFRELTARVALLKRDNVDTEVIIPISRLIANRRGQLGPWCFEPWRYRPDGTPDERFPLNEPRHAGARILVTGANFGCGSSREAAVWALWDMGFRCVIAESFGDIFRMNSFQNGLLPITLPRPRLDALIAELGDMPEPTMTVDLVHQTLRLNDHHLDFSVDAERRTALLDGLDEVGLTLRLLPEIETFEQRERARHPWVQRPGAVEN